MVRVRSAARSTSTPAWRGSMPRNTFSATVMLGASISSWNTMAMPWWAASRVPDRLSTRPSNTSWPESAFNAPAITCIRVDLPAPFSPMMAWMVPASTANVTSLSAFTPGNDLEMASTLRSVAMVRVGPPDRRRPRCPYLFINEATLAFVTTSVPVSVILGTVPPPDSVLSWSMLSMPMASGRCPTSVVA